MSMGRAMFDAMGRAVFDALLFFCRLGLLFASISIMRSLRLRLQLGSAAHFGLFSLDHSTKSKYLTGSRQMFLFMSLSFVSRFFFLFFHSTYACVFPLHFALHFALYFSLSQRHMSTTTTSTTPPPSR